MYEKYWYDGQPQTASKHDDIIAITPPSYQMKYLKKIDYWPFFAVFSSPWFLNWSKFIFFIMGHKRFISLNQMCFDACPSKHVLFTKCCIHHPIKPFSSGNTFPLYFQNVLNAWTKKLQTAYYATEPKQIKIVFEKEF